MKKTIKIAAAILLSFIAFRIGQALAFRERGYMAYGGECFLLLLPLFWNIGKQCIKDVAQMLAEFAESEGDYDIY